jgi:toxin-antitoxin system PIN domain toxin
VTSPSAALPDVNVLVALAWPNHVHHRAAWAWFDREAPAGWATAPVTELGFVRVSSNPRAIPAAGSPREAVIVLARICDRGRHEFWADDVRLLHERVERLATHRQVTDAHLLALARRRDGVLVTSDRGLRELAGPGLADRVVLLPG